MEHKYQESHRKNYDNMRRVYHITIGIVILGIGILIFMNDVIGLDLMKDFDPVMIYAFGGLCLLYGGFRLYRGIKKDF